MRHVKQNGKINYDLEDGGTKKIGVKLKQKLRKGGTKKKDRALGV